MTIERKVGMGIAGQPTGPAADVAEVFSTYLYTGNGGVQNIVNGIDLAGEGGLVWTKWRGGSGQHEIVHTIPSVSYNKLCLNSASNAGEGDSDINNFNSNGWTTRSYSGQGNGNNRDYASWTFRKKEKFFDVVTYTGNGVAGRTVAHGLNGPVGMMIVKSNVSAQNWTVYHKSLGATKYTVLNDTAVALTAGVMWNNNAPTNTNFTVGDDASTNWTGRTYVAYLFADNSTEDADDQMIKCGSFSEPSSGNTTTVNLGWEPQWVLAKSASDGDNWHMIDTMRGFTANASGNSQELLANDAAGEGGGTYIQPTSTGFIAYPWAGSGGGTIIYMAIRAPMMKEPEAATDVFALLKETSANLNQTPKFKQVSNFPVDFVVNKKFVSAGNWWSGIRLTNSRVQLNLSSAGETSVASSHEFDYNDGVAVGALTGSSDFMSYMWKRAKGYFDIVAYSGNSTSGRTVAHSLGVTPEMMWVRRRNGSGEFKVYHSGLGPTKNMVLNTTEPQTTFQQYFNFTAPTSTVFTLGNNNSVNGNSNTYVAFLFATLDGISKVGSFVGNGSSQTIDCGFSAGARFVIIKNTQAANHSWFLFDSARGIVSGNDPYLQVDKTIEQISNIDPVDPHNSGFIVNNNSEVNTYNQTYIFYAIA